MITRLRNFLRLKGSWEWAIEQMKNGKTVRPKRSIGGIMYRINLADVLVYRLSENDTWKPAHFHPSDMEIEWKL